MHSRQIYLFVVAFLAVMLLLMRRTEGLKPAESCKQSLDSKILYGKDDWKLPLDPKKCKGLKVSRGKDKCYVSDGKTWKSSSGCKKSWMGMVDWKWAHRTNVTKGSPFRVVRDDWMKYNHKSVSDDSAILGEKTDVENAQKCVDKCNDKSTECGGFSMGTKKNADGKYECWTRPNSSVQDPSTFKTKANYTLYRRKSLGGTASPSSLSPGTSSTTANCEAGKDGQNGVTGYVDSIGGYGAGQPRYNWCTSAKSIGDGLDNKISHLRIPVGMSATVYENSEHNGRSKDFQAGEHNLRGLSWDTNTNTNTGYTRYGSTSISNTVNKLEDSVSSIKIFRGGVPVYCHV